MSNRWGVIDLSHPLSAVDPSVPTGDPAVEIGILDSIRGAPDDGRRHSESCSRLSTCIHCGTHMDAPFHFFADGRTIEDDSARSLCGSGGPCPSYRLASGDRPFMFATWTAHRSGSSRKRNALSCGPGGTCAGAEPGYFTDQPVVPAEAVAVAGRPGGGSMSVVDFSIRRSSAVSAARCFLGDGLVIVENLTNLERIPFDLFELSAVPLAITAEDGSPGPRGVVLFPNEPVRSGGEPNSENRS